MGQIMGGIILIAAIVAWIVLLLFLLVTSILDSRGDYNNTNVLLRTNAKKMRKKSKRASQRIIRSAAYRDIRHAAESGRTSCKVHDIFQRYGWQDVAKELEQKGYRLLENNTIISWEDK